MSTSIANATAPSQTAVLSTNKVICDTCTLLSITLLFSVLIAGISMALNLFTRLLHLQGFMKGDE